MSADLRPPALHRAAPHRAALALILFASFLLQLHHLDHPAIKPLDEAAIVAAAQASGLVITVEEQSVLGGLGGAVAEVLSDRFPVPVKRLGIRDRYGESGPNEQLLDKYRLSAARVAEDVEDLLRVQGRQKG